MSVNIYIMHCDLQDLKANWRTFVLGGYALPAADIANWMLNILPPTWMPETYVLDTHRTTGHVYNCGAFLVSDVKFLKLMRVIVSFITLMRFKQWQQGQEDFEICCVMICNNFLPCY